MPRLSIVMPTYQQATFLPRALSSLFAQTLSDWELILVDDGSRDATAAIAEQAQADPRVHRVRFETNRGLGAALNAGLERAQAPLIGYLPSDDVVYPEHFRSLVELLEAAQEAVLAYSGVRHHYNRTAAGIIPGSWLQLVQTVHRVTSDRWMERAELVTDDLERMFWSKLRSQGSAIPSGQVTCEWVDHPDQLSKRVREPVGGINLYRQVYQVPHPLRFHTTTGNRIDEVEHYRRFRERPDTPAAPEGLKILLVGELAYNAERVLALEEQGHRLYGLWMRDPYWYNTVGPLPFGHVQDLPREGWREAIHELQPDVIYALLNWQAVPFVHEVISACPDVPAVWHFKEGPFISLEKGHWNTLIDLYRISDGHIYSSPEMRDWFETVIPGITQDHPNIVLDGDLPKQEWFDAPFSPRLSERDGELHTVVPGRPIGLHPPDVADLARSGIHLHFYGNFTHGQWLEWIEKVKVLAPRHFHLHDTVDQEDWVHEFSQYDAGWLHFFRSENGGDLRRANWDDLNYPARLTTLMAAGLPVLQRDNTGHQVATQSLVRLLDIGLFFSNMQELAQQMRDAGRMAAVRENILRVRDQFTFDAHVADLVDFFRVVIALKPAAAGHPERAFPAQTLPFGSSKVPANGD